MTAHALVLDGPCMGSYDLAAAPAVIRGVVSMDGRTALLDLPGDMVELGEQIHVYRREPGAIFLCGGRRGARTMLYGWLGLMDPVTGELTGLPVREAEWWEQQRALALSAWAMGEPFEPRPMPEPVA